MREMTRILRRSGVPNNRASSVVCVSRCVALPRRCYFRTVVLGRLVLMEYYTGIECFGYSADINPARHDIPPAHLVRVSHESKTGSGTIDLWVDR